MEIISCLDPFENGLFKDFIQLDKTILEKRGLYCVRIKDKIYLPERYRRIIETQTHHVIYIGKAQDQSLKIRLNQEFFHMGAGTLFRSIGAALGYTPIPGHLKDAQRKINYKFSKSDTEKISAWLLHNTEISVFSTTDNFFFYWKFHSLRNIDPY